MMMNMIVFGVLAPICFYQAGKSYAPGWRFFRWMYIILGIVCLRIYGASVYHLVIGG